ncbi:MAG: hypothetical protein ABI968_02885 [Acidobacteriota bacterium]
MRKALAAFVLTGITLVAPGVVRAMPVDKTPTVTGTVSRVVASQRTVEIALSDGTKERFTWNPETKINGTLTPGASVTVRWAAQGDGTKLALQIVVSRS